MSAGTPDLAHLMAAAAREAAAQPQAVDLVVAALAQIPETFELQAPAEDVWRSVVLSAFARFGRDAGERLEEFAIRSAQDVGRIVRALSSVGYPLRPVETEPGAYRELSPAEVLLDRCIPEYVDPSHWTSTIDVSVPCVCGYDLRGLKPEGRCPECGIPIGRSILGIRRGRAPLNSSKLEEMASELEAIAAFRAGVAPVAAELVVAGLERAGQIMRGLSWVRIRDVWAAAICAGVLDVAIEHHGQLAGSMLDRLALRSGEEIGQIVYELAAVGLTVPSDDNILADFTRVPDLQKLFAAASEGKYRGHSLLTLIEDMREG